MFKLYPCSFLSRSLNDERSIIIKGHVSSTLKSAKHLIPAVNGLHWRDSREIHKLLNDNKDFCIYYHNGKKLSVEKLAGALPVHLLAAIKANDRDENFENMLSGIRLLHTLCELTSRHSKLDQVLLDDVVLSAKMVDLVIYTMESWKSDNDSLVEATMVASTLHLLHGFISPEFQDIFFVLLAHSKVLELLKLSLFGSPNDSDSPDYPMGFLLLNAMRLADVFSDDSNFRCFYTDHFSMILSTVFCLSHEEFVSMLCSSALSSREEEATVDYDLFRSAGCVLSAFSSSGIWNVPQFKLNFQNNLTMSSYAHQRTSLLVKIIANLHCFSPGICTEDDRNRFINSFVSGLRIDPVSMTIQLANSSYTPVAQRATSSLLRHAEYLIASALNVKDLMMLSQAAVKKQRKEPLNLNIERASDGAARKNDVNENVEIVPRLKESGADARNIETSGLDTRSKRGKSLVEEGDLSQDFTKLFKGSGSGEGKEDEKKGKKRKRSIMSDDQMEMMEKAIADEPFMQRDSAWIRTWAEKLNQNGPGIRALQLKNWLSNRRAKLARTMSGKTRKCKK
ncbi:hypothetical protein Bca4012_026684 [Brassica carinata]